MSWGVWFWNLETLVVFQNSPGWLLLKKCVIVKPNQRHYMLFEMKPGLNSDKTQLQQSIFSTVCIIPC